jgi:serine protease
MPSNIFVLLSLIIAFSLQACGGGSSSFDKKSYSLSGTITVAPDTFIDNDTHDPYASYQANNALSEAQVVTNSALISGFLAHDVIRDLPGRFSSTNDPRDIYYSELSKGQTIRLDIVDWVDEVSIDFDLRIIDAKTDGVVSVAQGNQAQEVLSVPEDGEYYIEVYSRAGYGKYVLTVGAGSSVSLAASYAGDFVVGEAIIRYDLSAAEPANKGGRKTLSLKQDRAAQLGSQGYHLSHTQADRAALARFELSDLISSGSAASGVSTKQLRAGSVSRSALEQYDIELATQYPKSDQKLRTLAEIKKLNRRSDIAFAEPNYVRQAKLLPNDTLFGRQWNLTHIRLPQAWDITTGEASSGQQTIVAVLDTGVVLNHPDLKSQLVAGYDFIKDRAVANDGDGIDANPDDPGDAADGEDNSWHGTHVAGIVAAQSDNDRGVSGVSWGAKIMPLRILGKSIGDDENNGNSYDIMQALRYAAGMTNDSETLPEQPASIMNMSFGGEGSSEEEAALMRTLYQRGIFLVAAAGNESVDDDKGQPIPVRSYPAAYEGVISVAAIDQSGLRADYSNTHNTVDIAAPGSQIISTLVNNSDRSEAYANYSGTSMATPHIAGVIALMKAVNPDLSPTQFDGLLSNGFITTDLGDLGRDDAYGYGLIDAAKAVNFALAGDDTEIVIVADTTYLDFDRILTRSELNLRNLGSRRDIVVETAVSSESWLTLSPLSVPSGEQSEGHIARYQLDVDRNALADGKYSATVTFDFNEGDDRRISVAMQVGIGDVSSDAGLIYVLAINQDKDLAEDETPPQQWLEAVDGRYYYHFDELEEGSYLILAGSDPDNDLSICQDGEACGRYPSVANPRLLTLRNNRTGIDFSIAIDTGFVSSQAMTASRLSEQENTPAVSRLSPAGSRAVVPQRSRAVVPQGSRVDLH